MKPRVLMESYRLAAEVAQEDPRTIVFRASEELVYQSIGTWSAPVQLKWERLADGTFDLICRTVDLRSIEAAP